RLGMIGNWNTTLRRAYELHPDFAYFAFASDNDLRKPQWLADLTRALEEHPNAAIAYSRFGTTDTPEATKVRWLFDTRDISDPLERQRTTTELVRAGPVMYGLHRRETLERAGEVPGVLLSDVLFLSHLSLYGTFVQTPDVLWFRGERRTGWSGKRQRRALFAGAPKSAYLPVSLQHLLWLVRHMVAGERRPPGISRTTALYISLRYVTDWWRRRTQRGLASNAKRWKRQKKRSQKKLKPAWRQLRRRALRIVRVARRRSSYRRVVRALVKLSRRRLRQSRAVAARVRRGR
ncbi:MAG: hypothetical protein QOI27_1290, partial [Gaiellaceae bacterium]|nr:hypothetical protein [Gaiellaceae bacterium]